jgi:HTH-like domain
VFLEQNLPPKPLPRDRFPDRAGVRCAAACVTLGVSVSGCYWDWKVRPPSARTLRHAWLAGEIAQVHKDSGGTYGKLRITAELRYGRGIHVGKEQVQLLMKRLGSMGYRSAGSLGARRSATPARWIWCAGASAPRAT